MSKKGRTIYEEKIDKPEDFVAFIMSDFFAKNEYAQKEVGGEWIWQQGSGWFTAPKFMKYVYADGIFHIETWTRRVLFPGVYFGRDLGIDNSALFMRKRWREEIASIIDHLHQEIPENIPNQPIMVEGFDHSRQAKTAMICAVIGLVFAILGGWLSLVFAVGAIANGMKGLNSKKRGLANAAFILGIADIVVWIFMLIFSVAFSVSTLL